MTRWFSLSLILLSLCLVLLQARPAAAAPTTVAVMPFANASGDAGLDWLGPGISQTLTYKLSHLAMFQVVDAFLVQGALGGRAADEAMAVQVAQELGADVVVVGSFRRDKDRIHLKARFMPVRSGVGGDEEQSGSYAAVSLFDMQDRVALRLIKVLKAPPLTPNERIVFQLAPTKSLTAYESATRAALALHAYLIDRGQKAQLTEAASGFQRAVKLDPYYAEAFSQFALVRLLQGQPDQAYQLAQRSVELFSALPEGFAVLGRASFEKKKLAQAQAAASKALRLSMPSLYLGLARTTLGLIFQSQGKAREAADQYRTAVTRKPRWPELYRNLATLYKQSGQNDAAASVLQLYLQVLPGSEDADQVRQEIQQLQSGTGSAEPTQPPEEDTTPY